MSDEETAAQPPEPPVGSAGQEAAMAPEISRRVGSILDAVEREASRLRDDAQAEAARYSENARRRADDLVEERRRRISELSDELVAKSEAVVARLDDAAPVRAGFENLVRALGDAAERLSRESEETAAAFEPPPFHEGASAPVPEVPPAYEQPPGAAPPMYEPPPQPAIPAQQHAAPAPPPPPPPPPLVERPAQPAYEEQPHPARAPTDPGWQQPAPSAPPPPPPPEFRREPVPNSSWRELDDARMVAIQMASAGSTRGDVRGHLSKGLGIPDAEPMLDEIFGSGTADDARVPWMTGRR